ncbi:MAG: hypothetical protein HOV80_22020 [Polyangiaceae bacterium]|nr:hypothetical protein [Polyangiaceae bacterium]
MSMKVAVTTSLLVGLTASVAHAQESAPKKEECPTPEAFKAAGATGPTNDSDIYYEADCPPAEQPPAAKPTPTVQRVSYTEPAPQPRAPQPAYADEGITSYLQLAPKNSFELGLQGGYAQPFGDLFKGVRISDLADAGGEVAVDLGWRATPLFMLGATLRYNEQTVDDNFAPGSELDIRGFTAAIQGTFHIMPYSVADPYVTVGTGTRSMFLSPDNGSTSTVYQGWEIIRAQLGLDFRVARDFSMGPNAGAAMNMFFWQNNVDDAVIDDPRPNVFVFAGVAGRFQIGGSRVTERGVAIRNVPLTTWTASR